MPDPKLPYDPKDKLIVDNLKFIVGVFVGSLILSYPLSLISNEAGLEIYALGIFALILALYGVMVRYRVYPTEQPESAANSDVATDTDDDKQIANAKK